MNYIDDSAIIGKKTIIEYGAVISENVIIGDNCFIGYNTIIRPNVIIGNGTEIRSLCFIAEGARIGDGVKIIQLSNICKKCIIEDNVFIGPNFITVDTKKISHLRGYAPQGDPPYIESGVRIGGGVLVLPGVRIGYNSMIQAGSLLTKNTDPYGVYRGRPAIKIREVAEEERL
ncbi:MAG: DapH/DapD/GlmU-related protein [Candidatus Thorarchaeota archaeon]|jgi:acetyltransferase-like isoleucine patch superfamily enzyme